MALLVQFQVSGSVLGDGVSSSFSFDYTLPPFNLDFKGNKPVGVFPPAGVNPGAPSYSLSGTVITVTFPSAIPVNSGGSFSATLLFAGV